MSAVRPHVVVGYDGSAGSGDALAWAVEHALQRRLPLELVHAAPLWPYDARGPDHDERAMGRRLLDLAVQRLAAEQPSLEVTACVQVASAAQLLLHHAQDAALLVVGAHGRGGFPGMHLGSVSTQVTTHAVCPVLVARKPQGTGVVVGVDGSPASEHAVGFAFDEAALSGQPLTAVYAWLPAYAGLGDIPFYDEVPPGDDEQAALLSEGLAGWREKYPEVPVRESVVSAHPVAALLEASFDARLVVVGSRGRGGFRGLLLGSVSRSMTQHAACSVAVVRPHERDGAP